MRESPVRRRRHLLVAFVVGLVIIGSAIALLRWLGRQAQEDTFVPQQAAALLPAYREELDALEQAPRYVLQATVEPQTGVVDGEMSLRYWNRTDSELSELVFRLYPNAQSIYGGGSLTVTRVLRDGQEVQTEQPGDETVLHVPLQPALEPGARVVVDLSFHAEVPYRSSRGYGIFGRTENALSLAAWYPVLAPYRGGWHVPAVPAVGDALVAETSLFQVRLTVPSQYAVASTGTATGRQEKGQNTTWQLSSGPAREFTAAISDRFEVLETEVAGVTVRFHSLPDSSPVTSAEEALDLAAASFEAYNQRFGPYPYTEFDVVDSAVNIGGYEFPGIVFVEASKRIGAALGEYRYLVGHEVAHQWWYNLVGSPSVTEPWLDESLATYAVVIYLQQTGNAEAGAGLLDYWKAAYGARRAGEPPVNSSALEFSNWAAYRETVYIHGALFLDELRQELGDERFFQLLQRYQDSYRYRYATTADFLALAENVADGDDDLDTLFKEWFGSGSATAQIAPLFAEASDTAQGVRGE